VKVSRVDIKVGAKRNVSESNFSRIFRFGELNLDLVFLFSFSFMNEA